MMPPSLLRLSRRNSHEPVPWFILLLISVVLFSAVSCQTLPLDYSDRTVYSDRRDDLSETEKAALDALSAIHRINQRLETFKGIGKFTLVQDTRRLRTRAAWLGRDQGHLRMEIFGFPGHSAASFSSDGSYSYLYIHGEDTLYRIDSGNPSLEKILTLPITSKDLNYFLSGRIPIYKFDLNKSEFIESDNGYTLVLRNACFGNVEKIYMDKDKQNVRTVEVLNPFGAIIYRMEFGATAMIHGHRLPVEITISNGDGNRLHIHVEQQWTDVPVPPSAFILSPRR